jgi:ABC-type antimicrobial peptide transport system permease subunit
LVLSIAGLLLALILYFPLTGLIQKISPEIEPRISVLQILIISAEVTAISIISSFLPNLQIRKIYPLEIFR